MFQALACPTCLLRPSAASCCAIGSARRRSSQMALFVSRASRTQRRGRNLKFQLATLSFEFDDSSGIESCCADRIYIGIIRALLGKLPLETAHAIPPGGQLGQLANPWARQFWRDILALAPYDDARSLMGALTTGPRHCSRVDVSVLRADARAVRIPPP
eukprot:2424400-Pyramimonas_sp.AAC.1